MNKGTRKTPKNTLPSPLEKSKKEMDRACLKYQKSLESHLKKSKSALQKLKITKKAANKKKNTLQKKHDQIKKKSQKALLRKTRTSLNTAKKHLLSIEKEIENNNLLLDRIKFELEKFKAKEKALREVDHQFKRRWQTMLEEKKIEKQQKKAKKAIPHKKSLSPTVIILHDENHQ